MKILSADYLLPIAADVIENGAVAVEQTKIIAVGTRDDLIEQFPAAAHENFGAAVIMPGFVNAHSHLEITAMRGLLDDVEGDFYQWLMKLTKTRAEILTAADIKIAALAGAVEGIRAGVTCFGDIGRLGVAGFDALKQSGLRGVIFQETEFCPKNETAAEDFDKLKDKFLELRDDETALVKVGLSPHSPYTVSRDLFGKIADYAAEENIKISIHAAESAEEESFMRDGTGFFGELYVKINVEWHAPQTSSIEYLAAIGVLRVKPLLAHCIKVSDADIDLIAANDAAIAHCPKSNAKFGHGFAPFAKFLDQNLRVGFGSDSVASNNACDIIEESRFAALAARNLPDRRFLEAREIIETATLGGARAMRLESETGTLEAGRQADLIVVRLDNLAQMPVHDVYAALLFASNARDVQLTMVAGEELYRDGVLTRIDETEIKREMRAIAEKLKNVGIDSN